MFWLLLVLSTSLHASPAATPPPQAAAQRERTLDVARKIMVAARYCTLVTLGPDGAAQARLVDPLTPDAQFSIHVATNPRSRKVSELAKDPRVTLLYFDTSRLAVVTLIGRAVEVTGAVKGALHKKEWEGFFDKAQPSSYTVYRILPIRLEVVSAQDGLSGDPVTWHPDVVSFK